MEHKHCGGCCGGASGAEAETTGKNLRVATELAVFPDVMAVSCVSATDATGGGVGAETMGVTVVTALAEIV